MVLAEDLFDALSKKKLTLSIAESCTGGMLGSAITSVPGISEFFLGGTVVYCNDSKESLLGVPKSVMIKNGAVSEETAVCMAEGARKLFDSDVSISVTGIAGPGGGTAAKPVGLVWIGISTKNGTFARRFDFGGSRNDVRAAAACAALELIIETINGS
jgi:PncC family amidohydrolase